MPGMPIFQDIASQLKSQIYVYNKDTTNVVPLEVDNTGLAISGTVGLTAGTTVDLASGAMVGLVTGTTVGLAAGTTVDLAAGATVDLASGAMVGLATGSNNIGTVGLAAGTTVDLAAGATVDLAAGATVDLAAGTTVGLDAGSNVIGKVQNDLVFTSKNAFNIAHTLLQNETITANTPIDSVVVDISKESSYNWFFKNTGTLGTQDVVIRVKLSPDGTSTWVDDTGVDIAVGHGEAKMITVNNFLQYAKFTVSGNTADVIVNSCYQAQH